MPTTDPASTAPFADEHRDVDGVRMHALVGGDPEAPPVVLLAGFPQDARAWLPVGRLLAVDHRVVIADLPGQGGSDRPEDGADTETMARRVHGLVEQLGLTRYALVGHDVGAWVAFPYGLLFGDEVTRLALLDAGIPAISMPDAVPLEPGRARKTWHFAFHLVPDLPEVLLAGHERDYVGWFLRSKAQDPVTFSDADVEAYAASYADGGMRAGLAWYRATPRSAEQNRALLAERRFTMPVLGVSAETGSIPDMAAPVRPYADDVRLVTIAGSGHFIPEEQPAALAAMLREFIG